MPTGQILRLKDIARVQLGDEAYNYRSSTNGKPGTQFMVYQTSGSNATGVINQIDARLAEMSKSLPKGVQFDEVYSTKTFLDASMRQVLKTLFETFVLVVIITYIFLQDAKEFRGAVCRHFGGAVRLAGQLFVCQD